MIDVEQLMKSAPLGSMAYARISFVKPGNWQTALLIREESRRIRRYPKHAIFHVRTGLLQDDQVLVIVIMLHTPDGRDARSGRLYETWFNYHREDGGREYLEDWARRRDLSLIFYGDRGTRERQISIVNPLADLARQALPILERAAPWSMADFDAARARICEAYPDPSALWAALGASHR
jgi:hypothetical protein